MLSGSRCCAALPCGDLERAKSFYAAALGFVPADVQPDRLFYAGHRGCEFLLFADGDAARGAHGQLRFTVADIEGEVRELQRRGVRFEEYDFPGFDPASGIGWVADYRAAWFKDSEGNLLEIVQLPEGAAGGRDGYPAPSR